MAGGGRRGSVLPPGVGSAKSAFKKFGPALGGQPIAPVVRSPIFHASAIPPIRVNSTAENERVFNVLPTTGTWSCPAINTIPGSMLLVGVSRGTWSSASPAAPFDSLGNKFNLVGTTNAYAGFPTSITGTYMACPSIGGMDVVSANFGMGSAGNGDEITLFAIEVVGVNTIVSSGESETATGSSTVTTPTVTTTGPAILIAVLWGNSPTLAQDHSFTSVDKTWNKLPSSSAETNFDPNGYIQLSTFYKPVAAAGTYSGTFAGVALEGALMYIYALQFSPINEEDAPSSRAQSAPPALSLLGADDDLPIAAAASAFDEERGLWLPPQLAPPAAASGFFLDDELAQGVAAFAAEEDIELQQPQSIKLSTLQPSIEDEPAVNNAPATDDDGATTRTPATAAVIVALPDDPQAFPSIAIEEDAVATLVQRPSSSPTSLTDEDFPPPSVASFAIDDDAIATPTTASRAVIALPLDAEDPALSVVAAVVSDDDLAPARRTVEAVVPAARVQDDDAIAYSSPPTDDDALQLPGRAPGAARPSMAVDEDASLALAPIGFIDELLATAVQATPPRLAMLVDDATTAVNFVSEDDAPRGQPAPIVQATLPARPDDQQVTSNVTALIAEDDRLPPWQAFGARVAATIAWTWAVDDSMSIQLVGGLLAILLGVPTSSATVAVDPASAAVLSSGAIAAVATDPASATVISSSASASVEPD